MGVTALKVGEVLSNEGWTCVRALSDCPDWTPVHSFNRLNFVHVHVFFLSMTFSPVWACGHSWRPKGLRPFKCYLLLIYRLYFFPAEVLSFSWNAHNLDLFLIQSQLSILSYNLQLRERVSTKTEAILKPFFTALLPLSGAVLLQTAPEEAIIF